MPSTMKPKWLIDVYAMNRMMSRLPIAKMAPYKIEMVARTNTTGVAHWLASGNRPRQNLIMPKVLGEAVGLSPLLVLISVTAVGLLFSGWAVLFAVPIAAVAVCN